MRAPLAVAAVATWLFAASAFAQDPSQLAVPPAYQTQSPSGQGHAETSYAAIGVMPTPPGGYTGPAGAQSTVVTAAAYPAPALRDEGETRAQRVVLATPVGIGATFVGVFGAAVTDVIFDCNDLDEVECVAPFALVLGIGVPATLWAVGDALDGNGNPWATVLGGSVGAAGTLLLWFEVMDEDADGFLEALGLASLPTIGAIIGYELTSDDSARAARARETSLVRLRRNAAPLQASIAPRQGGATLTLSGAF